LIAHQVDIGPIAKKKRLDQLLKARLFFESKMATFGSGTLVEVTGKVEIKLRNRPNLEKLQNFRLFMVNIDADEAREYFEKIVKLKYPNVLKETIQIKQLPVGVIQIS
jgi:hypothetical protein